MEDIKTPGGGIKVGDAVSAEQSVAALRVG